MARKKNMLREAERYAQYLVWEATGGAMGKEPPRGKSAKEGEFTVDFGTKRALLDSMIKLIGMQKKVDPGEEEEAGVETYKEMLRNDGSGADIDRGVAQPPTAGSAAPGIRSTANGHAGDFLE